MKKEQYVKLKPGQNSIKLVNGKWVAKNPVNTERKITDRNITLQMATVIIYADKVLTPRQKDQIVKAMYITPGDWDRIVDSSDEYLQSQLAKL